MALVLSNCISLVTNDVDLYMCVLAICRIVYSDSLHIFKLRCILPLNCKSSLYILDTVPYDLQIFSPSMSFVLTTFLMLSFEAQQFYI